MKVAFTAGLLFAAVCVPVVADETKANRVVVTPAETDEILANPHMGWQTFARTCKQDENLPDWIPSTVCYTRWTWRDLEPEPGKLNTELLDEPLKACHEAGQTLAIRASCCAPREEPSCPAWLAEVGGRVLSCDRNGRGPFAVPDLDDPTTLKRHLEFIAMLGAKYDGHPDLDHVDLGSVGWFGEWHMSGSKVGKMPSLESRQKVVAAYLAAFKKTPILMLLNGGECLKTATSQGAGWRADCLGDLGGFSKRWTHMRDGYPSWIQNAGALETWKTAPVAWETCWDARRWVAEGWPLRYIFNYALATHASYINNKSAPLPEGANVRPEIERFLRRLGYRLVLKELTHPDRAKAGENIDLGMKWQNTGSAPCYKPYRLAYRLTSAEGKCEVIVSKITVNRWLPGDVAVFTKQFFENPPDLPPGDVVSVSESLAVPKNVEPGSYRLSIAVVGEDDKPVVRLGIKGRSDDGWYPLSTIRME